jgi:hypothetical protein
VSTLARLRQYAVAERGVDRALINDAIERYLPLEAPVKALTKPPIPQVLLKSFFPAQREDTVT